MVLNGELLSSGMAGKSLTGRSKVCSTTEELWVRLQAAQFLHGLNPLVGGSAEDTLMLDLTTISLMFMGLRKATMGGFGIASLQRLEE